MKNGELDFGFLAIWKLDEKRGRWVVIARRAYLKGNEGSRARAERWIGLDADKAGSGAFIFGEMKSIEEHFLEL